MEKREAKSETGLVRVRVQGCELTIITQCIM